MIKTKDDLKLYIKIDKEVNLRGKTMSCLEYYAKYLIGHENVLACEYLKCLRKYEYTINTKTGFWGKMQKLWRYYRLHKMSYKCNILISPNCCGYGLRLTHFKMGGIIINCKSMGNYCSANVGVVVGNKDSQENIATIGDNVSLTIGCKVIGKVIIGNNVVVAPNSVVVKDIPDNCVVSGIPAIIIKQNGNRKNN